MIYLERAQIPARPNAKTSICNGRIVVAIAGGKLLMVSCIRDARERERGTDIYIEGLKTEESCRKKSLVLKDQWSSGDIQTKKNQAFCVFGWGF